MIYEKVLKSDQTILAEIKVLAPDAAGIKVSGGNFVVITDKDLTQDEIDALAAYNSYTMGAA